MTCHFNSAFAERIRTSVGLHNHTQADINLPCSLLQGEADISPFSWEDL